MKEPSDIGIHDRNYYVCDFKDHNVVVVSEEGKLLRKIGSEQVIKFAVVLYKGACLAHVRPSLQLQYEYSITPWG